MPTVQPYQITTTNQEVVITLNRSLIEQESWSNSGLFDYQGDSAKKPVI